MEKGYLLTYEMWEQLGYPDIDAYVIDNPEEGFFLDIDPTDASGNGIPDFLDQLAGGGGDIDLNPSQGVVTG